MRNKRLWNKRMRNQCLCIYLEFAVLSKVFWQVMTAILNLLCQWQYLI